MPSRLLFDSSTAVTVPTMVAAAAKEGELAADSAQKSSAQKSSAAGAAHTFRQPAPLESIPEDIRPHFRKILQYVCSYGRLLCACKPRLWNTAQHVSTRRPGRPLVCLCVRQCAWTSLPFACSNGTQIAGCIAASCGSGARRQQAPGMQTHGNIEITLVTCGVDDSSIGTERGRSLCPSRQSGLLSARATSVVLRPERASSRPQLIALSLSSSTPERVTS
jgi:hypothetical protein